MWIKKRALRPLFNSIIFGFAQGQMVNLLVLNI